MARPLTKTLIPTLPTYNASSAHIVRHTICRLQPPKATAEAYKLTHRISSLPPKKPRINRRRNNNNAPFPAPLLKERQGSLNSRIQSLGVHLLHQLKPLEGRILHRRPPNRAGIVHEHIKLPENAHRLLDRMLDLRGVAHINGDRCRVPARFADLALYCVDGGLR